MLAGPQEPKDRRLKWWESCAWETKAHGRDSRSEVFSTPYLPCLEGVRPPINGIVGATRALVMVSTFLQRASPSNQAVVLLTAHVCVTVCTGAFVTPPTTRRLSDRDNPLPIGCTPWLRTCNVVRQCAARVECRSEPLQTYGLAVASHPDLVTERKCATHITVLPHLC